MAEEQQKQELSFPVTMDKYVEVQGLEQVQGKHLTDVIAEVIADEQTNNATKDKKVSKTSTGKNGKSKIIYEASQQYRLAITGDKLNELIEVLEDRHAKDLRNHRTLSNKTQEIQDIEKMMELNIKLSKVQERKYEKYKNPPVKEFKLPFEVLQKKQ